MSKKDKKLEGEQGYTETNTFKITPVVQHKSSINVTRVAAGGHPSSEYSVRRGGNNYGPASGAYQQLSHMGADNLQKSRTREKKDMQELNERLANYIEKVRFLEAQNRKLVADLENLRSKWGKETAHVKAIYEAELTAARKLLDDSEKGKAELELRVQALMEEIQDLSKNNDELKKDVAADKETIERQNTQLSEYEAEIQGLRRRVGSMEKNLRRDKDTIKKLQEELARCKQDLDNETLNRVCAENDRQGLQEELDFTKKVHEQEMKELAALAYRDTTPENREFWKNEMAQCLHELQTEYEVKLDGMRGELESYYNAKLHEFRTGATRNNMETTHTKDEVKRLRTQLNDLRSKITDLEARNAHLEKLLQELQREYDEKQREWDEERTGLENENTGLRAELESVLQELQNLLDAKLSLELEIAAYRKLLEGEETRVGLRSVVENLDITTTHYEKVQNEYRGGAGDKLGDGENDDIDGGKKSPDASRGKSHQQDNLPDKDQIRVATPEKPKKKAVGAIKGEMSSRTTYQRSAKGNISIVECSSDGKCVTVENTGKTDNPLEGWRIVRKFEGTNRPNVIYTFPDYALPYGKKTKIWAKGQKPHGTLDLEMNDKNWGTGQNITTCLYNTEGDERATHVQKTTYSS